MTGCSVAADRLAGKAARGLYCQNDNADGGDRALAATSRPRQTDGGFSNLLICKELQSRPSGTTFAL